MTKVAMVLVLSLSDSTRPARAQLLRIIESHIEKTKVSVVVKDVPRPTQEALEALRLQGQVVFLDWTQKDVAHIQIAKADLPWLAQSVAFTLGDPLTERAKTLAFSVLAMAPEWKRLDAIENEAVEVVTAPVPVAPEKVSRWAAWVAGGVVAREPSFLGGQLDGGCCFSAGFCVGAQASWLTGRVAPSAVSLQEWNALGFVEGRWFPQAKFGLLVRPSFGVQRLWGQYQSQESSRLSPLGGLEVGGVWQAKPWYASLTMGGMYKGGVRVVVNETQVSEISGFSWQGRLNVGFLWGAVAW